MKKRDSEEIVFGVHPVMEALQSEMVIDKILTDRQERNPKIKEILSLASNKKVPVQNVPHEKLNKITHQNHQGIIALTSAVRFYELEDIIHHAFSSGKDPLILVLDGITDIRNFGAICRTALCFGVDGILVPSKRSARLGGDAMKTSAGALSKVRISRVNNIIDGVQYLIDNGFEIFSASEKAEHNLSDLKFEGPAAIVMGSEDSGVTKSVLNRSQHEFKIEQSEDLDSLNVSVATGIVLYKFFSLKKTK